MRLFKIQGFTILVPMAIDKNDDNWQNAAFNSFPNT